MFKFHMMMVTMMIIVIILVLASVDLKNNFFFSHSVLIMFRIYEIIVISKISHSILNPYYFIAIFNFSMRNCYPSQIDFHFADSIDMI